MKKLTLMFGLLMVLVMAGCGGVSVDYTTAEFEKALNDGKEVNGKMVEVHVDALEPASAFGYNIQTGEHLNFVSAENPSVKVGDVIVVKVERVASMFGSYMVTYEKQ